MTTMRRTLGLIVTCALVILVAPLTAEAQPPANVPWLGFRSFVAPTMLIPQVWKADMGPGSQVFLV
jgi:hypothetical protein